MRILGIDPGLDRTGWAVLEKNGAAAPVLAASGLIHTSSKLALEKRLAAIFDELAGHIARHAPDEAAIEEVFFSKRADTQANTTHARGVILLACEKAGLPIYPYNPRTIKKTISGSGSAEKKQMQRMVQLTLKLASVPEPDDVADAMAAALCHLRLAPVAKAIAKARQRAAC
ncbi:MAG TPA: crossover junction endodeoxyribonuclease RuvC [Elusimicrobia bacterium]|nr:MAG: crossover junction endodeoxyribonuclease RuvC [Elusimicrobia bacterium GWF2_62_30]HBA61759.1 crossover junction endodeoxyribonuclease RuvC [Elusimicrobiota bacterium]